MLFAADDYSNNHLLPLLGTLDYCMQYLSGLVDPYPFSTFITAERKIDSLGTGYQGIPSFNENKYI